MLESQTKMTISGHAQGGFQRVQQTVLEHVQSPYKHHVVCRYSTVHIIVVVYVQYG